MSERIERQFHEIIWDVANRFNRVEAAVVDGRDLAYAVRNEKNDMALLRWMAEQFIDRYGSDPLKEQQ